MTTPCIAVVGTPNSGKTTLYNWLTGSRFKTVNYPGATVEYSIGSVRAALGDGLQFMDTPGVYGLDPKSADEEVTIKALYDRAGQGPADGVLVVVDGTQLERHLQLVLQVRETGFPFLVVVTMSDLLRKEGVVMNWAGLSQALGVPVLPFDGLLGGGLREIVAAAHALPPRTAQLKRPPADEHLEQLHREAVSLHKIALNTVEDAQARLKRLGRQTRTLDQIFLHPILGPLVFLLIMTFLFSSIYWMAKPYMEAVDGGFSWLSTLTKKTIPQPILADFLADGVIASFSAVLVFVPQIFILFVGIGLLESTGYLARAATLIDRLFSAVGLTGRSFVPILSSFSCAVPAIIASRKNFSFWVPLL